MLRIFRHFLPLPTLSLAILEYSVLTAGFYFTLHQGWRLGASDLSIAGPEVWVAATVAATVVLGMIGLGLYSYNVLLDYRVMVIKSVVALALFAPLAVGVYFLTKDLISPTPGTTYSWPLSFLLIWIVCLALTRSMFVQITDSRALRKRLIVLGTGATATRLNQLVSGRNSQQVEILGFYTFGERYSPVEGRAAPVEVFRGKEAPSLFELAKANGAEEIVVATDDRRGLPVHELLRCKVNGVNVVDYLTFIERETRRIDLDNLQPGWLIFSDGFRSGRVTDAVKRTFDIVVSLAILVATLPLLLATAIAIKLEDGGPIFYRQERVGRGGRSFMLYKFRSMRTDAEKNGHQWAAVRDPRVTRVGAIIRKLRIDELPQIICVLRGEMSFIGPRPERPVFVEQLAAQIPFYNERHCVRPGISGWAQINYPYGASVEDARQKLSYDLYYVKNRSIFLDFLILIQTLRVIVWPEGAR